MSKDYPMLLRWRWLTSVLAVAIAACGDPAFDGKQIVVGAVVDQTGSEAESSWIQAMEFAIQHVNDALEALGRNDFRFRLRVQDSENVVVKGVERATTLVRDENAQTIICDTTQVTEGILATSYDADAGNDLGVPVQCSSCTSGNLLNPAYVDAAGNAVLQSVRRNEGRWMSRTTMTTVPMSFVAHFVAQKYPFDQRVRTNADFNGDGVIKIAVLGSDEAFGQAGTSAVRNNAAAVHTGYTFGTDTNATLIIERILHPNVGYDQVDFGPIIDRLLDNDTECMSCAPAVSTFTDGHAPDFIVMVSFQQFTADFTEEYELSGKARVPVIHFHTFRQSSTLYRLGALAEGQVGISHELLNGSAPATSGGIYRAEFRAQYGFEPNFWDTAYYDNAMTFMLATLIAQNETGSLDVTPELVRDRVQCTSQPVTTTYAVPPPWLTCPAGSATLVRPGADGVRDAVREIAAGRAIDYDGASGPVDYDVNKNVRTRVNNYRVLDGVFQDYDTFECLNPADNRCGR